MTISSTPGPPDLTWKGKLGLGGACAACCAVPMLVVTGAVSAGAAMIGGVAVGAMILVGVVAYAGISGRVLRGR